MTIQARFLKDGEKFWHGGSRYVCTGLRKDDKGRTWVEALRFPYEIATSLLCEYENFNGEVEQVTVKLEEPVTRYPAIVVVKGGVAYEVSAPAVHVVIVDLDNISETGEAETLPKDCGFEVLAEEAGLTDKEVVFV